LTQQDRNQRCVRKFSFARRIEWTYASQRLTSELFDAGKLKRREPLCRRESPLY
jgi:hypothetical protein